MQYGWIERPAGPRKSAMISLKISPRSGVSHDPKTGEWFSDRWDDFYETDRGNVYPRLATSTLIGRARALAIIGEQLANTDDDGVRRYALAESARQEKRARIVTFLAKVGEAPTAARIIHQSVERRDAEKRSPLHRERDAEIRLRSIGVDRS